MDEYQRLVKFASSPLPASLPMGDLEPRRRLREKLQCKDFRWYLQHVTPHLFVPKITPQTKAFPHLLSSFASQERVISQGGALRNQALDACQPSSRLFLVSAEVWIPWAADSLERPLVPTRAMASMEPRPEAGAMLKLTCRSGLR